MLRDVARSVRKKSDRGGGDVIADSTRPAFGMAALSRSCRATQRSEARTGKKSAATMLSSEAVASYLIGINASVALVWLGCQARSRRVAGVRG